MQRTEHRPSNEHIQRSCRGIQQQWDASERRLAQVAMDRQRQLLELISDRIRNAVA